MSAAPEQFLDKVTVNLASGGSPQISSRAFEYEEALAVVPTSAMGPEQ
jgi:hypothetical protein